MITTSDKVDAGLLVGGMGPQVKNEVLTQHLLLEISGSNLPVIKYLSLHVINIEAKILPQEPRQLFQRQDPLAKMSNESSTRDLIPFHPI